MTTYLDLIARKSASTPAAGFDVADLNARLYPHQSDLTRWALRRGRAALFAATGLGKGPMLLTWSHEVAKRAGRVLVLAPLAVGKQLEQEARKFGVEATYERKDTGAPIVIANYEMLHAFDASAFAGVVLDESSILKSFDGAMREALIKAFARTPYRLACTATPAPNDFTELGNHSEFLGLKTRAEMLAEFFVHDGGSTQDWRLKGHAVEPFWRWVASWGAVVTMPHDLGYEDGGFELAPLRIVEHVVPAPAHDIAATGLLFAMDARSLNEQRAARRATIESRVRKTVDIVNGSADQALVWCELNDEQDLAADWLADTCVSIQGTTPSDEAEEMIAQWLSGGVKTLVTKSAIYGFGINMQNCHQMAFVGASHSFERTYQAIRRCWRFGQKHEVAVHMVRSEIDGPIVENYRRKEVDHARMTAEMVAHVGAIVRDEVRGLSREFNPYEPQLSMRIPEWLRSEA